MISILINLLPLFRTTKLPVTWFKVVLVALVFLDLICCKYPAIRQGDEKLVYRLILLFSSTEIFSKRRKIYTWNEGKPEFVAEIISVLAICTMHYVFPLVGPFFEHPRIRYCACVVAEIDNILRYTRACMKELRFMGNCNTNNLLQGF